MSLAKQLLQKYGLLLVLTLFIANAGIMYVTNVRSKANTCFTTAQLSTDTRCLYVLSGHVYSKGSRANPHHSHPCGMDVTSIIPSFHTNSVTKYLDPNYVGDICAAGAPSPTTPPAQPTGTPVPTTPVQPSMTPSGPTPTIDPNCSKKNQGDADCDGLIKLSDYDRWRREFYGELTTKTADFNGDARISLGDHSIWRQTYFDINGGPSPTPGGSAPSPTPGGTTPTLTPPIGPSPTNGPPITGGSGIWISTADIMKLPMSGAGWSSVKSAADSSWGTANLSDNNSMHDVDTLAGALVAVRTGDGAMKQKTIAGLQSAMKSPLARALELGRGLQSYVIAADIIGYHDPAFETWVRNMVHAKVAGHSCSGEGLLCTAQSSTNNWGGHARASVTAAALYLKDTALATDMANSYKAFIGLPSPNSTKMVYTTTNWHAGSPEAGVNVKGAVISGQDVSGVLPEDWRRAAEFKWPPAPTVYMWEGMQGYVVTAVLLHRANLVPITAADSALNRAMDILYRINNPPTGDDTWMPWVVNYYTGSHYPTSAASAGKNMGWTDWTHVK